jgi:hypothetical protein
MRLVGMRLVGRARRRIVRERKSVESDGSTRNPRRIADAHGTLACLFRYHEATKVTKASKILEHHSCSS